MASNAKQTRVKRTSRRRKAGRDRKKAYEKNGTTKSETQLFGNALNK